MEVKWKNGLIILWNKEQVYPPSKPPYYQTGVVVGTSVAVPIICNNCCPLDILGFIFLAAIAFAASYGISSIAIIAYYQHKWHQKSKHDR